MYGRMAKQEAAEYLGVSIHWINERLKTANREKYEEFFHYVRPERIGKKVYFMKSDLDAYRHRDKKRTPAELRAMSIAPRLGLEGAMDAIDFAMRFLEANMDKIERNDWMEDFGPSELRTALCEVAEIPDPNKI